jgi:hypothetical protein
VEPVAYDDAGGNIMGPGRQQYGFRHSMCDWIHRYYRSAWTAMLSGGARRKAFGFGGVLSKG